MRAKCDPGRMLERIDEAFELRHTAPARAIEMAKEELVHAETRGHRHAIARAHLVLNYAIGDKWEPARMLTELEASHQVFVELEDHWSRARSADLLAFIYEGMGDYPSVLHYTEQSLESSRRLQDINFEANAHSSMVGVLTAAGDLEGARRHLEAAMVLAERIDSERLRVRLVLRRARIEREAGDPQESLRTLEDAWSRARAFEIVHWQAEALGEMAAAQEALGDFEAAERLYEASLEPAKEELFRLLAPPRLLGLARLAMRAGRYDRAVELAEECLELAERYLMQPVLAEGTRLLADALRQRGDLERAFETLGEHVKHREGVMRGEADRALRRFEAQAHLDAAQKDAEIYRLKYVELEAMQAQLLESERMGVVGSLAAGLTHEMNTPLGVIRSSLDTSRRAVEKLQGALPENPSRAVQASSSALDSSVSTAKVAVGRLEGLVKDLGRFTRLDEAEYTSFDVNEELAATLGVLQAQWPEGIEVQRELAPVPALEGWPAALNQAFFTLLTNAVEALQGEGTIRVATRTADGEVEVLIADDGPGIPADLQARLFELELTREGARARFRVGLAMVKSLVQRHRGRIELETGAGKGTAFRLRFPVGG